MELRKKQITALGLEEDIFVETVAIRIFICPNLF